MNTWGTIFCKPNQPYSFWQVKNCKYDLCTFFCFIDWVFCKMSVTDDWVLLISICSDNKNCSGVTKTVVWWQRLSYARLEVAWLCYVHPALSNRSPLKKALRPFWYMLWLPLCFLPHQKQLQWCMCVCEKLPIVCKQCEMQQYGVHGFRFICICIFKGWYLHTHTSFGSLWNDSVDFIGVWNVQLASFHQLIKVIAFVKSTA